MWGFAYGLLDVLNKHFQEVLHISRAESAGLQGAYFGLAEAYLNSPILADSLQSLLHRTIDISVASKPTNSNRLD